LSFDKGRGASTLTVLIRQPYRSERGTYLCDYEIKGFDEIVRRSIRGVDSLHALLLAITCIQKGFWPYRKWISWLGSDGEDGLPYRMLLSSPINGRLRQAIDIATDEYEADLARQAAERADSGPD
jgi:hypothetical protein